MIQLLQSGEYSLIETKGETKIIKLDSQRSFAWVNVEDIGEILVATHVRHWTDHILCLGRYRIYLVKDEKDLIDTTHLELCVGNSIWQGYLLPTGLPDVKKKRSRIIPTREVISKSRN